jgi:hypothetical protein
MAEIIKSEDQLRTVDHQDLKLLFEYGTYTTIVLISSENLHVYHSKLTEFSLKFEEKYQDLLSRWSGEIYGFDQTTDIIEEIFEVGGSEAMVKIEKLEKITKRFIPISIAVAFLAIINWILPYILLVSGWLPIFASANWLLYILVILPFCLFGLIVVWVVKKIQQKLPILRATLQSVTITVLFPQILNVIISLNGILIYMLFGNLSWVAIFLLSGFIAEIILIFGGIYVLGELQPSKGSK